MVYSWNIYYERAGTDLVSSSVDVLETAQPVEVTGTGGKKEKKKCYEVSERAGQ